MKTTLLITTLAVTSVLFGCAITKSVRPIAVSEMTELCIKNNPQVMMKEFPNELRAQIERKGIKARMFDGAAPPGCRHHVEYTANWRWDLAMYLAFAEINVYENGLLVGQASYDARAGGGRLDKFGTTADKLRELLDELFPRR